VNARRAPPSADHLLDRLEQRLYPANDFLLVRQVRNATGVPDGLRVLDAIVIETVARRGAPLVLRGFEVKRTWQDLAHELENWQKRAPFQEVCTSFSFVVPWPAEDVVRSLSIPVGVGLIEVRMGEPVIRPRAHEYDPGPVPPDLLRALFRQAWARRSATAAERRLHEAGLVERLDGGRWRLTCDHSPRLPIFKPAAVPETVVCPDCVAGLPPDPAMLAMRIADLPLDALGALRDRIDARLGIPVHDDELGTERCAACHARELAAARGQLDPVALAAPCPSCAAVPEPVVVNRPATLPAKPGPASCAMTNVELARAAAGGA
jgi:hypothetical protein